MSLPSPPIPQRYLALDDRVAWAHFEFPEDLFNGETVEEWVPLNGRQGNGEEGNINIILSLQVRIVQGNLSFCHLYCTS